MFKKILLALLIVYAILGFILIPRVLKPKIIELSGQALNAKLSIGEFSFNPFIFKVTLSDVKLYSLDDKPLVDFESLVVDLELYSLFVGVYHINEITLTKPTIFVVYDKNRIINLTKILKTTNDDRVKTEKSKKESLPHIIVDKIEIDDGEFLYTDLTKKDVFHFAFKEIGFKLQDIDTDDFNSSNAKFRFYTSLDDGGFVDFKTNILGFAPLKLEGNLDFAASKLYSQWKYMKDELNLEVADGKVFFNANYHFNADALEDTSIENFNLSLEKLRVIPKNKAKDVLNLDKFYVKNATIKPFRQDIHLPKVGLLGLNIQVKRDKDGNIDWLEFIKVKQAQKEEAVSTQEENTTAWSVQLDELALEKIGVSVEDSSVSPMVKTELNRLDIYAQNMTLKGDKPFTYNLDLLLNKSFRCTSQGSVIHQVLQVESMSECRGFDVSHYTPYIDQIAKKSLKKYNLRLKGATLDFAAKLNVIQEEKGIVFRVSDANSSLSKLKLYKKDTNEKLLSLSTLNVSGVRVDSATQDVSIDSVTLNGLNISTLRHKDGSLNIDGVVVAKKAKKGASSRSKVIEEKPYSFVLKHFSLYDSSVAFKDKTLKPYQTSRLDKIKFDAYNIDIAKKSWLDYKLSARVNKYAKLKAKGKLRHTPLKEKGTLSLQNLRLKDASPYIQEKAFVNVVDGKLSFFTKTYYNSLEHKSTKRPDTRIRGKVSLKDLLINDSRNDMPLISLNKMDMKSFTFELFPNRLFIDEIVLHSFYVDAMIDANKTLNFSKLSKSVDTNVSKENNASLETQESPPSLPIKILKVSIEEGNAKFADYSIPIQFKTDIHSLNGAIYAISNTPGETSYVDIKGEVDEYGSTKLKGSINSANPKEYTDLSFNFQNLELSSMSGYSATFAGHEIEAGKLYLDLGYKINNSQLRGSNSVIIKKIKLGKEVEDENVTVLPLGFVIALLEDSDGIIDIDMPVEGNIDEPDFKYGALVWKTIGNLISKAVTSPFRFLGSLMGFDGDDLEYAEFEFGSAQILPAQREKLDNITKMMIKRPKISLKITPTYDEAKDTLSLQRKKLLKLVLLKSGVTNEKEHESAMSVETLETIYREYKQDDTLEKLALTLHENYNEDAYKRAYLQELIKLCTDIQVVSLEELEHLALTRASVIKTYLVSEKNLDTSRVLEDKIKKTELVNNEKFINIGLNVEVE